VARLATDDDVIAANALPRISRTFFSFDYQLGSGRKPSLMACYSVEFQAEGGSGIPDSLGIDQPWTEIRRFGFFLIS
jgi:hypothetical protein